MFDPTSQIRLRFTMVFGVLFAIATASTLAAEGQSWATGVLSGLTVMLVYWTSVGVSATFEARARRTETAGSAICPRDAVQQEMQRARRFGRPLSLVVLRPAASGADFHDQNPDRRSISQILAGRVHASDVVASVEDTCLVVLPETDAKQVQSAARRMTAVLKAQFHGDVQYGFASFPQEELTLTGATATQPLVELL